MYMLGGSLSSGFAKDPNKDSYPAMRQALLDLEPGRFCYCSLATYESRRAASELLISGHLEYVGMYTDCVEVTRTDKAI